MNSYPDIPEVRGFICLTIVSTTGMLQVCRLFRSEFRLVSKCKTFVGRAAVASSPNQKLTIKIDQGLLVLRVLSEIGNLDMSKWVLKGN